MENQLHKEFDMICKSNRPNNEQELFYNLLCAIKKNSFCEAHIIHGAHNAVEYNSTKNYIEHAKKKTNPIRCELADISFLVEDEKQVRFFLVQNKKAKKFKLVGDKFKADLYQYELLHDKPDFRNIHGVRMSVYIPYKGDELKKAKTDSVSVYGVFYKNCGEYDMRVYSASHLRPIKGTGKSKERTVRFNSNFNSDPIVTNGIEEFADCKDLVSFEAGIRGNLIGEPIYQNQQGNRIIPAMLEYIRKLSEEYQENNRIGEDLPLEIPNSEGDDDNESLKALLFSLYFHSDKIVAISI